MNVLLVLLAFWLPGLAVGAAVGLRGWTLAASGPALTFGVVAVGVPILGKLGITWNLLNVALWALLLAIVGFGASLLFKRFTKPKEIEGAPENLPRTLRDHLIIGAGVVIGLGVGLATFVRGSHSLDRVQQGWDAPYHGNLVRWIAEHGDARPSTVGTIANLPNQTDYFYPDTYHALLALVFGKAGLGMPQTLNLAVLAVILAVPLGVAALGTAWRMPAIAVGAAAAVTTWFTAFPYDSLWRGPLWPYVAGVAMLPALLAITRHLIVPRGLAGPVGISLALAGLAGLHTSLAFVATVYLLIILVAVIFRFEPINWRVSRASLIATVALGVVFAFPLVLPALYNAAGVTSAFWSSEATVSGAIGETILFSPMADFPLWWIGIPALIGIFVMVKRRRNLWMVASYVVFGGLFAATVSLETPLIHTLTGIFYNDHWRLAALVPLAGSIAFGEAINAGAEKISGKLVGWRPSLKPAMVTLAAAAVLGLLLAGLSKGGYIGRNSQRLGMNYGDGPTVSHGEEAAYKWLSEHVKPGERVMNDRSDGSVWMYALYAVWPVEWTFYGTEANTKSGLLTIRLNDLDHDPRIRPALTDLKVRYVIKGKGLVTPESRAATGLQNLDQNEAFKVVYQNDDATVYEIEGQENVVTSGASPGSSASGN
ncbi:DUF6541 family protein [Amycolatopsis sp. cg5]|uniref:DUF6541 family protein n=1 Tax=Amycolatopsis sp. cg5 TaxID=3238802 RepID=UPI003524BF1E